MYLFVLFYRIHRNIKNAVSISYAITSECALYMDYKMYTWDDDYELYWIYSAK